LLDADLGYGGINGLLVVAVGDLGATAVHGDAALGEGELRALLAASMVSPPAAPGRRSPTALLAEDNSTPSTSTLATS